MDMLNKLFFASSFALLAACTTAAVDGQSADATMRPGLEQLPQGVEQYSRIYWVHPDNEPHGPYFQVENDVVTGVTYMVMQQDLIDGVQMALPLDVVSGLPAAASVALDFSPGHAGMSQAHYDITINLVADQVAAAGDAPGLDDLPVGIEQYSRTLWIHSQDVPMGPYFKVEDDKVTALSYMVMHDNFVNGAEMVFQLDTVPGLPTAQRVALDFSPGPDGMAMPHYDMTIELVSP